MENPRKAEEPGDATPPSPEVLTVEGAFQQIAQVIEVTRDLAVQVRGIAQQLEILGGRFQDYENTKQIAFGLVKVCEDMEATIRRLAQGADRGFRPYV